MRVVVAEDSTLFREGLIRLLSERAHDVVASAGDATSLHEAVAETGARMQIMNTYHLWLRPGPERVAELGGLHAFARWPHAIATDSGGFQAFSLAERTKMTEDGFEFASHLDGKKLKLTPEEAMRIQGLLGSDIAMQLDVCLNGGAALPELVAEDRTVRATGVRLVAAATRHAGAGTGAGWRAALGVLVVHVDDLPVGQGEHPANGGLLDLQHERTGRRHVAERGAGGLPGGRSRGRVR